MSYEEKTNVHLISTYYVYALFHLILKPYGIDISVPVLQMKKT